jgi:hypothetical protein
METLLPKLGISFENTVLIVPRFLGFTFQHNVFLKVKILYFEAETTNTMH